MKCWICNINEADSDEHYPKASDLRFIFDQVSTHKPLYRHDNVQRNKKIFGIKSKKLTFQKILCKYCNETRTQPYDDAWRELSKYLWTHWDRIRKDGRFDLSKIFLKDRKEKLLFVHLYCVKLFGCLIVKGNLPIDISIFSKSLMNQTCHPDIRLVFCEAPKLKFPKKHITITNIAPEYDNEILMSARWAYIINPVAVRIDYINRNHRKKIKPYMYIDPRAAGKIISLGSFKVRH